MNYIHKLVLTHPSLWPAAFKAAFIRAAGGSRTIVRTHGIRMVANLERGKGMWCSIGGLEYEPEMRPLISLLRPGDVFVDVGANVGVFSLHAGKRVGPEGKVFAYEPTAETHSQLLENICLNGFEHVVALNQAAGAEPGSLDFAICESYNSNHLLSSSSPARDASQVRKVAVDTIDALAMREGLETITAIKIDAEGFEREVMLGARESIRKWQPTILFESFFSGTEEPDRDFLLSNGYRLFRIKDGSWSQEIGNYKGNLLGVARIDHASLLGVDISS